MSKTLNISAGNLVLALDIADATLYEIAKNTFHFFLTEKNATLRVKLSRERIRGKELHVSYGDKLIAVETEFFKSILDFRSQNSQLTIAYHDDQTTILRNAVKNLFVFWVLSLGGVVLHASAVVHGGKAHVFAGPSGVGKSTVVDNAQSRTVLSEEVIALVKEQNNYNAFALPYSGDERLFTRSAASFELGSINILMHAKANSRRKLTKSQAMAQLYILPAGLTMVSEKNKLLKRYDDILSEVPCYKMGFKPDPEFWELFV